MGKIGARLKDLRERSGVTRTYLAGEVGVSRNTIYRIEEGETADPGIDTVEKILNALGVSLAEFFESNIPEVYEDPRHHEIHERVQRIIERGPDESRLLDRFLRFLEADHKPDE